MVNKEVQRETFVTVIHDTCSAIGFPFPVIDLSCSMGKTAFYSKQLNKSLEQDPSSEANRCSVN
jgi:hypothetical protein